MDDEATVVGNDPASDDDLDSRSDIAMT